MNIYEIHGFVAGFADRERETILSNVELENLARRLFSSISPYTTPSREEKIADFKQCYLLATRAGDVSKEYERFRNAFDSMVEAAINSVH